MEWIMRHLVLMAFLIAIVVPGKADPAGTDTELAKLLAAIEAQGCSGGEVDWDEDDQQFDVEESVCADGRKYALKFDAGFKFIGKKLDDRWSPETLPGSSKPASPSRGRDDPALPGQTQSFGRGTALPADSLAVPESAPALGRT
jgi:hypothetical protein